MEEFQSILFGPSDQRGKWIAFVGSYFLKHYKDQTDHNSPPKMTGRLKMHLPPSILWGSNNNHLSYATA